MQKVCNTSRLMRKQYLTKITDGYVNKRYGGYVNFFSYFSNFSVKYFRIFTLSRRAQPGNQVVLGEFKCCGPATPGHPGNAQEINAV